MKHIVLFSLGLALALPLHAEEAPAKGGKAKPDSEKVFKKKDADSNGSISKEEFTAGAKDETKAGAAFDKKDADSDGKLSPEEFAGKGGKAGGGKPGGAENGKKGKGKKAEGGGE